MELKEFIKTAITDITNAISELQAELQNDAIVNPTLPQSIALKTLTIDDEVRPIEQLAFDVAVIATEASELEGEAKAGISIFGAKIGTETNASTQNVSRLSFSIPIVFPTMHVKSPRELMREKKMKRPDYDDHPVNQ